jgi:two-component system chemotaxis response regulator CheB
MTQRYHAVVIGASAGALDALSVILPALPQGFVLPVLVVVHVPPDNDSIMVQLFRDRCQLAVCEGEDKELIEPGVIYFAPPDYHLMVESPGQLSLSSEEPVNYSRPAIDMLFETAADVYGPSLLGVVLTGASSDGAQGLRRIIDAGGVGLVQLPNTAHSSAMPQAALEACPTAQAMTLEQIADYLCQVGATT